MLGVSAEKCLSNRIGELRSNWSPQCTLWSLHEVIRLTAEGGLDVLSWLPSRAICSHR